MNDVFEKYAKLRELYPEDIKRIEDEENEVKALLGMKEFYTLEGTQRLIALCRTDILFARKKLATDRSLTEEARRELWFLIDSRSWFIETVSRDYGAELERIQADLETELSR